MTERLSHTALGMEVEAMIDEGGPPHPPHSSKEEEKEEAKPTHGQQLCIFSPPFLPLRSLRSPPRSPSSSPALLPVPAVSLFSSLSADARQRLLALRIKLRTQQLQPLQQRITSTILRLTPFPAEPPPPPQPPPPALPPAPSVVLLDPRQFLVRRPSSSLFLSIPSLAPFLPARPPIYTAAQLLARMPVQALPTTVSQPVPSQPFPSSLPPSSSSSSIAKARRDAELAEAARRHAQRLAEVEEQKQRKESMRQRRALRRHFLAMVKAHREGFVAFHKMRLKTLGGLARAAGKNQEVVERRRKAMEEKAKKDRMRALKENDMSEYLKLLEGHKNDRLTALLAQTDEYLKQLSKMIRGGGGDEIKQGRRPRAYIGRGNRTWRKDREDKEMWEQKEREAGRDPNVNWAQRQAQLREEENEKKEREEKLQRVGTEQEEESKEEETKGESPSPVKRGVKEMSDEEEDEEKGEEDVKEAEAATEEDLLSLDQYGETVTEQPKLLSGGTLKGYQLKGLEWMVGLYNSKMNGSASASATRHLSQLCLSLRLTLRSPLSPPVCVSVLPQHSGRRDGSG